MKDLQDVLDKLEAIHAEVKGLSEWRSGLQEQCRAHHAITSELKRTLRDSTELR